MGGAEKAELPKQLHYTGGVSDGQVGNGVCGNRTNAPPQRQKQLPLYEEDTVYLKVHHQIRRTRSSNMEN
jgi:hypothetical protein